MKPDYAVYINLTSKKGDVILSEYTVSKLGYGKTQKEVKLIFEAVAKEKWVLQCEKISNAWLHRFLERIPNHSLPPHSVTTSLAVASPPCPPK